MITWGELADQHAEKALATLNRDQRRHLTTHQAARRGALFTSQFMWAWVERKQSRVARAYLVGLRRGYRAGMLSDA